MSKASTVRWLAIRESMEYPTIRRDQTSLTAHRYGFPSPVGCSLISVSHNRFGPDAVKSRWTRSSCTGGPGFLDSPRLRECDETIPASEQIRHTRCSDRSWPASASSCLSTGDESVPEPGIVGVDLDCRVDTASGGTQTEVEPHRSTGGQPQGEHHRRTPEPSLAGHQSTSNRLTAAKGAAGTPQQLVGNILSCREADAQGASFRRRAAVPLRRMSSSRPWAGSTGGVDSQTVQVLGPSRDFQNTILSSPGP